MVYFPRFNIKGARENCTTTPTHRATTILHTNRTTAAAAFCTIPLNGRTASPRNQVYIQVENVFIIYLLPLWKRIIFKEFGGGWQGLVVGRMDSPLDLSLPKVRRSKGTALATKPSKNVLYCNFCKKGFDRPSLLKRHIRTHTGKIYSYYKLKM